MKAMITHASTFTTIKGWRKLWQTRQHPDKEINIGPLYSLSKKCVCQFMIDTFDTLSRKKKTEVKEISVIIRSAFLDFFQFFRRQRLQPGRSFDLCGRRVASADY